MPSEIIKPKIIREPRPPWADRIIIPYGESVSVKEWQASVVPQDSLYVVNIEPDGFDCSCSFGYPFLGIGYNNHLNLFEAMLKSYDGARHLTIKPPTQVQLDENISVSKLKITYPYTRQLDEYASRVLSLVPAEFINQHLTMIKPPFYGNYGWSKKLESDIIRFYVIGPDESIRDLPENINVIEKRTYLVPTGTGAIPKTIIKANLV